MPTAVGVHLVFVAAFCATLVLFGLPAWGLFDALTRPKAAWRIVGHDRRRWLLGIALGMVLGLVVGALVAFVYLRTVRPKLEALVGR